MPSIDFSVHRIEAARRLREKLTAQYSPEIVDRIIDSLDARASAYPAHANLRALVAFARIDLWIDDGSGMTFEGSGGGLGSFFTGRLEGSVFTDDLTRLYGATTSYIYTETVAYVTVIFLDKDAVALGSFQGAGIFALGGVFGGPGSFTSKSYIKSASAELYLNHSAATRILELADRPYDPASGAYDGTLWVFEPIPNDARYFIRAVASGLYLNHLVSTASLSLADQKYDPATGAYDGTLWERIFTPHGLLIKSPFAELYLNHRVSDRYLGMADQKHDPATGAYDGTLWSLG